MAKKNYTLSDILGAPMTRSEALTFIKDQTDGHTIQTFNLMKDAYREKLIRFIMGKNGLAITYDPVFRRVIMPSDTTNRLEDLLSAILGEPATVEQILPREGSQITETGSLVIADIIARLQNGSMVNVEMQKAGYDFPGERCSCYTSDMIMRQYNYLKNSNSNFSYKDMKSVYLIIFMETSPALFHTTKQYVHKKCTEFDTGIKLNLLDNITFISLDTFKDEVHNINTKRDAWLKFLTEDDPDEIVNFVNQYPEFLPCYKDLIAFRQNPKELINMFSDALKEMDKNTERYMVEELNKKVKELNEELNSTASINDVLATQNNVLATQNDTLAAQNDTLTAQNDALHTQNDSMAKRIAELEALLHESQS